jgi:hypothetical protein
MALPFFEIYFLTVGSNLFILCGIVFWVVYRWGLWSGKNWIFLSRYSPCDLFQLHPA